MLGTLTFLDRSARTASARAIGDVIATFVSREDATQALEAVPSWINVIIRDAVGRLKQADERFLAQIHQEETLKVAIPNIFDHAAQLAGLLAMGVSLATINTGPQQLFPLANVWGYAELTLGKRQDYIQSIFRCFVESNLVNTRTDPQWGLAITPPDPVRLKAFAGFARHASQTQKTPLAIDVVELWMKRLVHLSEQSPNKKLWSFPELIEGLQAEATHATTPLDEVINLLIHFGIIESRGGPHNETFVIEPAGIVRRLIFERVLAELRLLQVSGSLPSSSRGDMLP